MKFRKDNLVTDVSSLQSHINNNSHVTYVNMYSLRVKSNYICESLYIIDGWPVYLYLRTFTNKNVKLLTFSFHKLFWVNLMREKKCLIVGHTDEENSEIKLRLRSMGIKKVEFIEGFINIDEIIRLIHKQDGFQLVLLALSQPKQEEVMAGLKKLNVPVVSCGAFIKQVCDMERSPPIWLQRMGLAVFYRFILQPRALINRAFIPLLLLIFTTRFI